ncbi:MAG: L-serine ammonia-lyase [Planctomycetota bacterium]|nr:L-serine ammonia-lyase [Planctomycetota bacterium]
MAVSVFDLFSIGIGPSSSHTVGPMRAARLFAQQMATDIDATRVTRVHVELFGSLGLTGKGHGTDKAILLGLLGKRPETLDPDSVDDLIQEVKEEKSLSILGKHPTPFTPEKDLTFNQKKCLPFHANGMIFQAFCKEEKVLEKTYYSVGGGFVVDDEAIGKETILPDESALPFPFQNGAELLKLSTDNKMSISQLMLENECTRKSEEEVRKGLLDIWQVMKECVKRGFRSEGILAGGLNVKRRAPDVYQQLTEKSSRPHHDPLEALDWVNLYALSVNEENAAGGRVVTAPTNGAAGIIPAVLHYYEQFCPEASEEGIVQFLLVAGAIGLLYKENASISGAEVGCQGEVGVACSMAAGALVEALGGTAQQVENAAEIGMEHNLGLTCDPIGGLVQIPCIERNAMGATKAINAARIAMRGDGEHHVSLDKVIQTMKQTGADMMTHYKETSQGGLAVNIVEC